MFENYQVLISCFMALTFIFRGFILVSILLPILNYIWEINMYCIIIKRIDEWYDVFQLRDQFILYIVSCRMIFTRENIIFILYNLRILSIDLLHSIHFISKKIMHICEEKRLLDYICTLLIQDSIEVSNMKYLPSSCWRINTMMIADSVCNK